MMVGVGSYLMLIIAVILVGWIVFVIPHKPWDDDDNDDW